MITIRQCTPTDRSDLQHLNDEVFRDNATYDDDLDVDWAKSDKGKKYFTELLQNDHGLCLIAEDGNTKIGYLTAAPKKIEYRNSSYVEIQNMGVTQRYQSQGIGKLLLESFFEWAESKGFQKAFVNSFVKNTGAVSFYKKNGFHEIDISLEKQL